MQLPENIWRSPVIQKRLLLEANIDGGLGFPSKPQYYFLAPEGDTLRGEVALKNFKPDELNVIPHETQMEFTKLLRHTLQSQADNNGIWLVGWTHPPANDQAIRIDGDNVWGRLVMIWLDEDADPHYVIDSEFPVNTMIHNGTDYYVGLCERAHEKWREEYGKDVITMDMELSADNFKKAAIEALK